MADILSFVRAREREFDEETTKVLREAFDAACALLGEIGTVERQAVAYRILELADAGERDPIRLRDAAIVEIKHRWQGQPPSHLTD